MNELYLLTGAAGYLGSTILRELLVLKKYIRAFIMPKDAPLAIQSPLVENVYGDITDKTSLKALFENTKDSDVYVIHTAGIISIASRFQQKVYDVNVGGTKNIIELCKQYHVKKLVYVSSVHAIPEKPQNGIIRETSVFNPNEVIGLYAQTKAEATLVVLNSIQQGVNASVVHPSGIIGPNDRGSGYLTQLIIDFVRGSLTAAVNGGYDFVDVRDVTQGIISCCKQGEPGGCYILSNQYFELKNFLNMLHQACTSLPIFDKKKMPRQIKTILPMWFAKCTAPLAELYYRILRQPPLYTAYSLHTLTTNIRFSHEKADKILGYTTRPMINTLMDTVIWLKETHRN